MLLGMCYLFCRFGEDSQERILDWIEDCDEISNEDSIIDLGCGNCMLLVELVMILVISSISLVIHGFIYNSICLKFISVEFEVQTKKEKKTAFNHKQEINNSLYHSHVQYQKYCHIQLFISLCIYN